MELLETLEFLGMKVVIGAQAVVNKPGFVECNGMSGITIIVGSVEMLELLDQLDVSGETGVISEACPRCCEMVGGG